LKPNKPHFALEGAEMPDLIRHLRVSWIACMFLYFTSCNPWRSFECQIDQEPGYTSSERGSNLRSWKRWNLYYL